MFANIGPNWPMLTNFDKHWPYFGRISRPKFETDPPKYSGKYLLILVTPRPPNSTNVWPVLVEYGQTLARFAQVDVRSFLSKIGHLLADFGELLREVVFVSPRVGQVRPTNGQFWPTVIKHWTTLTNSGPIVAILDLVWPDVGRICWPWHEQRLPGVFV